MAWRADAVLTAHEDVRKSELSHRYILFFRGKAL